FSVDTPWQELEECIRDALLYGSKGEAISFTYLTDGGGRSQRRHKFEGIIPNLERRYRETEASPVREELSKYISERPCTDCGGARLDRSARNVFVGETPLPDIVVMPIDRAVSFFERLELPGWRGEIAAKIVKEIRE